MRVCMTTRLRFQRDAVDVILERARSCHVNILETGPRGAESKLTALSLLLP